ncbi:unnamed protein product [Effrenium voratum]|nr:unnamed protein product [Effrenium voratum]
MGGALFMGIWCQGIINAYSYFITDYVSQMWYFSGGMRKAGVVPASSVVKAAWLATRYHLGTMIGGGLQMMLSMPFRVTVGWLDAATRNPFNPVGCILGGCCDCCVNCYKSHLYPMSRNGYLDVSLQATTFGEASEHVIAILDHEAKAVSVLHGATWLFQIVGLGTMAVIGNVVTNCQIKWQESLHDVMSANYVQQPVLLAATGGAVALVVAFPFMMLIDVASDSILFCRTVQKMRHKEKVAVSSMAAEVDRACGRFNGLLSGVVGCHCAGRDRPGEEEEWGLLSLSMARLR